MAHQRLAARLLALRTRQLENKLSQVSDDYVPSGSTGSPRESRHTEDNLSPVSDDCVTSGECKGVDEKLSQVSDVFVTTSGVGSLQESNDVADKFSLTSNNCVTAADISCVVESNQMVAVHHTEKFSELQSNVSVDSAREIASS